MKRFLIIVFGLAWYICTIIFIVTFVKHVIANGIFTDYLWGAYFLTLLLALWQNLFIRLVAKAYDLETEHFGGGTIFGLVADGHFILALIFLITSPLLLVIHLVVTLRWMFFVLFHRD